ncbi:MAG: hypothetical protein J6T73_00450, partial [Clostridia bacterium]|nr:hypothetical protein [Clostridia bacterium]
KKTLVIIGLSFHIVYYIFAILSLGNYGYTGTGNSPNFQFWIYAMIISLPCVILYTIDAVKSLVKQRTPFIFARSFYIFSAIPLLVFIGATLGVTESIIWNIYFGVLFILELVSLFLKPIKKI